MTTPHIRAIKDAEITIGLAGNFITVSGSGLDIVLSRAQAQHLSRALKEAAE